MTRDARRSRRPRPGCAGRAQAAEATFHRHGPREGAGSVVATPGLGAWLGQWSKSEQLKISARWAGASSTRRSPHFSALSASAESRSRPGFSAKARARHALLRPGRAGLSDGDAEAVPDSKSRSRVRVAPGRGCGGRPRLGRASVFVSESGQHSTPTGSGPAAAGRRRSGTRRQQESRRPDPGAWGVTPLGRDPGAGDRSRDPVSASVLSRPPSPAGASSEKTLVTAEPAKPAAVQRSTLARSQLTLSGGCTLVPAAAAGLVWPFPLRRAKAPPPAMRALR